MDLIVDSREPIKVRRILKTLGVKFIVRKLDAGDYETDHCIFERKTVEDFFQSIQGNRIREGAQLFDQLDRLVDYAERAHKIPFVCITGSFVELEKRALRYGYKINYEAVYGAIASILVRYGVNVLHLAGDAQMFKVIMKIEEKIAEGKLGVPHRAVFRRIHRDRRIAHIANCLRVSPKVAERLFKRFGGLYGVLTASDQELLGINGIGPVTLARIKALLGKE